MRAAGRFTCVICGGAEAALVVREADGRTIVRCAACGMRSVHPMPSAAELDAIYQDAGYFGDGPGEEGVGYREYEVAEAPAHAGAWWRRLKTIGRLRPARGSLVDVGCAYGGFLRLAREAGWQVRGVEPSAPAVRVAREDLGLDVILGTLAGAALPDASQDAVTLWEVIEHVPDPLAELREVARVLRPGGVAALSTPNAASLRARQEGPDWYGYHVSREHVHFFSADTLGRALRAVGLEVAVVRTRGVDPSLRRLVGLRTAPVGAAAACHPGLAPPPAALLGDRARALLRLRGALLRPLERFGLGHNLEVYGVKPS